MTERGAAGDLARFAAVGGLGTLTNLAVFWLVVDAPRTSFAPPLAGAACAFGVAVTQNYALNELWTFRGRAPGRAGLSLRRYASFVAASLLGFAVNAAVLVALLATVELPAASIAQAIGIAAGMGFNFAASRLVVFRRGR
ncbi:MAG: GtrA family protein [Myxococcota bacterium]|nr:GtrA family protein [Myxococcales bacterium]